MNRDEKIKEVRPDLALDSKNKKPIELFQNETLRPILKLQHDISIGLLKNHSNFKSEKLFHSTEQQIQELLKLFLQKNLDLKNQLLGLVIGHFTMQEYEYYKVEHKEIRKRIIQMQLKRYYDSRDALIKEN